MSTIKIKINVKTDVDSSSETPGFTECSSMKGSFYGGSPSTPSKPTGSMQTDFSSTLSSISSASRKPSQANPSTTTPSRTTSTTTSGQSSMSGGIGTSSTYSTSSTSYGSTSPSYGNTPSSTSYRSSTSTSITYKAEDTIGNIIKIVEIIGFVVILVAVICAYSTIGVLTRYPTHEGEIVGRAIVSEFNIGKMAGFFFVVMYLGAFVGLISQLFVSEEKRFICSIVSSVCCFIAWLTFDGTMNEHIFTNNISNIPYSDNFSTILHTGEVNGPGGFTSFLFILLAIVFAVIAFIRYKRRDS